MKIYLAQTTGKFPAENFEYSFQSYDERNVNLHYLGPYIRKKDTPHPLGWHDEMFMPFYILEV